MLDLYNYDCHRQFLIDHYQELKDNNPSFSIRAFALKTGISKTTLSSCMNQKGKLSPAIGLKAAEKLNFSNEETNYFINLIIFNQLPNGTTKEKLKKQLILLKKAKKSPSIQRVQNLLDQSEVSRELRYQEQDKLTFRVLSLLISKNSQQPLPAFIDHYYSYEHQVASTGYFLPNVDGSFTSLLDTELGPTEEVVFLHEHNQKIKINFCKERLPHIKNHALLNLKLKTLVFADQKFDKDQITIDGYFIQDGKKQIFRKKYMRIK